MELNWTWTPWALVSLSADDVTQWNLIFLREGLKLFISYFYDIEFIKPFTGDDSKCLQCYDPVSKSWSLLANSTQVHLGGSVAVLDGKITISGGYASESGLTDLIEQYDTQTDSWSEYARYEILIMSIILYDIHSYSQLTAAKTERTYILAWFRLGFPPHQSPDVARLPKQLSAAQLTWRESATLLPKSM
jgi:hypothetical protein